MRRNESEVEYLRRQYYRLAYDEKPGDVRDYWLSVHSNHCLIPDVSVDPWCPLCVVSGWLPLIDQEVEA